jgi:hypothetical protein
MMAFFEWFDSVSVENVLVMLALMLAAVWYWMEA